MTSATTVFNDTFTGSGAPTAHVPDLSPLPSHMWDTCTSGCALSGGYAGDPGSSSQLTYGSSGSQIPIVLTPIWDGTTQDGFAVEWSWLQHGRTKMIGANVAGTVGSVQIITTSAGLSTGPGFTLNFTSGQTGGGLFGGARISMQAAPSLGLVSAVDGTDYPSISPGTEHIYRLELVGEAWKFYLDGALLLTQSIAAIRSANFGRSLTSPISSMYFVLQDDTGSPAATGFNYFKVDKLTPSVIPAFWTNFVGSHENP